MLPISGIHDLNTKSLLRSLRFDALEQMWGKLALHSSWTDSTTNLAPNPRLIFIVDDDPDVRAVLQEFLEQHDLHIKSFDNELALLDAAARESPGTILLDIVLPWINGLSLCNNLRHHPATAHTRLISMSSLGRPSDRRASMQAGADAFLPKPIDLQQLLGLVSPIRE
jgi:DNA-binding response OmpR family regulator